MARKMGHILRWWACGIATLCLFAPICVAQRYSFRDYTEGLSDLAVNCILQDRTGYLWVGTDNGLYRYDGLQFRPYGVTEGVRARYILNLYLGMDGTLWVGSDSGVFFQRRDGSFAEVHPPGAASQFTQHMGTAFAAISPDRVTMADQGGAFLLRRVEADKWVAESMRLEGGSIWSVLYGPDGALWYGCDTDLCRLKDGKTTRMRAALKLPEDEWRHLLLSHDGHIWLRGYSHLGELLPGEGRFELHDLPGRASSVQYVALAEDGEGHIMASQGPAFGQWENGQWRMVTMRNGLPRFDLSALFADREGSIWLGVAGHGLMRWLGQDRWEAYTAADGLSDDIVWAMLRDRSGRLWIGTESGLDWIPAGESSPRVWQAPGVQSIRAVSLAESADGSIWIGSAAGNLIRINPKTLAASQWKTPEIYCILSDGSQHLWLATAKGLYVVDMEGKDQAPRLVEAAAFANPRQVFRNLTLDPANHLWATSEQNLYRLDGTNWHRIDTGLFGGKYDQIAADRAGNVWVTGDFPGVMRLRVEGDRVTVSEQISRPKLLSEETVSLLVDRRGWLWVGQDAGITVFDGRNWRSFTQDDGLIWNDCDSSALIEDKDGSMWIGTSGGLSHMKAPNAVPNGPTPSPVFSQVNFGSTPIANGSEVLWSASPLEISMASLSFRGERHFRIRYRLLGLETEWVETGENNLRYPRLAPGSYKFQAAGVDPASGALTPIQELSFRIEPRWWQSSWLTLALVLLAAVAVVGSWRWRVRHLVSQKRHLEHAVQLRTEDLEREKAELLRAEEQMRHYAEHDDLTGLWNHRIIIDRLRQEVDRSRRHGVPLSVILVDLDHFKQVNDTYGHPAGDLVLKEISAIFQRSVRSYDWVGRYGGEEFLLILPGSNFLSARIRAEQFRVAVETARILDGKTTIPITASFGVASGFPSDYEAMIHTTDTALYKAKANGRNCVVATEIRAADHGAGA
ncbi:MAG: diguanylate cyclase [Terracidiphilus sp.]